MTTDSDTAATAFLPGGLRLDEAIRRVADAFVEHDLLFAHGTGNALDEAHWLLLETLALSPLEAPDYTQLLDAHETARCNAHLVRRIHGREPVAFITGRAWFAGLEFISDARALVPRSPLAEWISSDFYGMLPASPALRVLDLCTGGGSIAIACAVALPDATVDASDLSREALSLARENVELHALGERVRLLEGSLFEPVSGAYDLIVSNPPYVDAADMNSLGAEFAHEPALALAAGEDGLDIVRQILGSAAACLTPAGLLVVEVGNSAPALAAAFPEVPFQWLDFEAGGTGVFVLTRSELETYCAVVDQASGERAAIERAPDR